VDADLRLAQREKVLKDHDGALAKG